MTHTTIESLTDALISQINKRAGKPTKREPFFLPLGPKQEGIQFTQFMTVGVFLLRETTGWEVSNGALFPSSSSQRRKRLQLIPMPEDKARGTYCAYSPGSLNNYTARLRAAGYMSTVGRAPVRGYGATVGLGHVRKALLKCLDRDPRIRSRLNCNFTELFGLVGSFGDVHGRPVYLSLQKKRLIKLLLEELYGSHLYTEEHIYNNPEVYQQVYDLEYVDKGAQYVYSIALPPWMFDLNVRLVEAGYSPLIPSWGGATHHQFNGPLYTGGCSGFCDVSIAGLPDGKRNHPRLHRIVLPLVGSFTLELTGLNYNDVTMVPSGEWEDLFRTVAENLLKGRAPKLGTSCVPDINSLMLAASREIPIILQELGGTLRYMQADQITNSGHTISMVLNNWPSGEPAIHPKPKAQTQTSHTGEPS